MDEQEFLNNVETEKASLTEGGGTAKGGDGGSNEKTPSACPSDSQLPQGGSLPTDQPEKNEWIVDLNREEFVAFRLLLARVNGPLRMRIPTLLVSIGCCLLMVGIAIEEWWMAGWQGYPDPVMLCCALLVLLPGFYTWFYVPAKMKKTAGRQYDRSISAGMLYCGRLTVTPDYVEKAGATATAHIRLDDRTLFVESAEMMAFVTAGSPALVLPARCLTEEMATAVRKAADNLPAHCRRFIARVVPGGETVRWQETPQPEEVWVSTYTYTEEEYVTVLRGLITQHYWRTAPMTVTTATCGALLFGWDGETMIKCIPFFLVILAALTLFNLVLPLSRVKRQVATLSAHDLTMQVRMDTLALRLKMPKGGENWVLWCDVDHVYDKENFVEFVHDKSSTLHIPKRVIPDMAAFESALNRCRGTK